MIFLQGCGTVFIEAGLKELVVPAIWESSTFLDKLGQEKEGQMWLFQDKGSRNCCLVPEITAIVQQQWRDTWSRANKGLALFYIARCYRYDRPQMGRYREFTQVGAEWLGEAANNSAVAKDLLMEIVNQECPGAVLKDQVARGLAYYTEEGFEVEADWLGAQKQVAGGGRYPEGLGWAIGLDRLDLARNQSASTE